MKQLLNADNKGIPLFIFDKIGYHAWLKQQTSQVQNWLKQTSYKDEGISLIPNAQGELEQVLFVTEHPEHYFSCGDIIKQLPQGQYLLNTEAHYQDAICFSWLVGSYQYNRYKKSDKTLPILSVANQSTVDKALIYAEATALTRDLINTPAADMMPKDIGVSTVSIAERFGGQVTQIIGDDLLAENYPTIHAVGRASVHAPQLIDLTWGDKTHPKVTLVGKGVCFDSGGLDLKPAAGMRNMKKDMGGSAHVLGLAQLIMAHNLPINLRVLIPAVENAVSNNAFRPGDVITTRKGITVEIDNTDAEGRLVLCDALTEAENDQPELLIDFATLTGAMRVALGTELPGFFSTNDDVAAGITAAGLAINDPVWRMPLHDAYKDMLKSQIADMTNCSTTPFGGAITAALYLQEFISDKTDWVHFDVMAFNVRHLSGRPLGGEAFGIRAVFDYLQNRYR
ncbi:MAG: leucyl aminopeptidase [Alteromonadaceae bacterium]|jgi:leucyl aminopeptidase